KYRFIDQPGGWMGGTVKVDWPMIVNLRLDPFERTGLGQSLEQAEWFKYEFWRFVFVQEVVAKAAQTFVDFPPLQPPASFNMDAVRAQVVRAIQAHHSA
ncbi:MAG TPA: arylsulfatase, partial [Polyangia bacterium]